jgi:hypothetical protein
VRGNGDDIIPIGLGHFTVADGGGSDTLEVPLVANAYPLTESGANRLAARV